MELCWGNDAIYCMHNEFLLSHYIKVKENLRTFQKINQDAIPPTVEIEAVTKPLA